MSDSTLKSEIEKGILRMQTLRDEVRVRLHLAGMDAKEEWDKLEPHIADIERKAEDLTDATRKAVDDALKRLSTLRSKLS